METSPLRFLDYDVSLMLADQVRISKEVEARRFHVHIFLYKVPFIMRAKKLTIHRVLTSISKYWGDFWDEELSGQITKMSLRHNLHGVVGRRIILYEEELKNIMDGLKHLKPKF